MQTFGRRSNTLAGILGFGTAALIIVFTALADPPQPGLTITQVASNEFSIIITNGSATTNYTLFWTDVLEDVNYPWLPLWVGDVGETNFGVEIPSMDDWPHGFFRALVGSDGDGDGVLEQQDADSNDSNVGILSLTINSPTNGQVLQ